MVLYDNETVGAIVKATKACPGLKRGILLTERKRVRGTKRLNELLYVRIAMPKACKAADAPTSISPNMYIYIYMGQGKEESEDA